MSKSIVRTLSFFSQWAAEVLRQPWLMIVLVLGPFIVLFLFGYGEVVGAPRPRTIVVVPAEQQQSPLAVVPDEMSQFLRVEGTTSNVDQARQQLRDGDADLVVVVPPNPSDAIQNGRHAQVQVLTNEIDPVRLSYEQAYIRQQVDALNRRTVEKAVAMAQNQVGDIHGFVSLAQDYLKLLQSATDVNQSQTDLKQVGSSLDQVSTTLHQALNLAQDSPLVLFNGFIGQPLDQLRRTTASVDDLRLQVNQLTAQLTASGTPTSLSADDVRRIQANLNDIDRAATQLRTTPPDVIAAPFSLDLQNVAPWTPAAGAGFYAPAVLVLLIQHLGVTLGALSMSRVRLLGLVELFQTSPVRPVEVTVGNYLSYGTLCVIAGGALLGLVVGVLNVPVFGPPAGLAGALLLLIAASVGIGLVLSMLSSGEQQAAQLAMLVLIGSVFFSGFLVALDTLRWPVRIVSYLLPATYAIRTLDDVMLRGTLRTPFDLGILATFAVFFFAASMLLFRREFRAR
jgi:ABC-2 type transport system permease protein